MRCFALLLVLLLAVALPADVFATDLEIQKETVNQTVQVGETFDFIITVRNTSTTGGGPLDSPNTTVLDDMPPSLTIVAATSTLGECMVVIGDDGNADVLCDLGEMVANSTVTITITVEAQEAGTVRNTATVEGGLSDPDESDNSSFVDLIVEEAPSIITISKTLYDEFDETPAPYKPGGIFGYLITIKDERTEGSPVEARMEDVLPSDLGVGGIAVYRDDFEAEECQVDQVKDEVVCVIPELSPGDVVTYVIDGPVSPRRVGEICNTAILKINGQQTGEDTACHEASERLVPREDAIEATAAEADPTATVRTSEEFIPAGSQVCDAASDTCMEMDEPVWISLIDPDPNALYGHETTWATIPAGTDQEGTPPATVYPSGPLPPVINISNEDGTTTTMSATDLPVVINPAPAVEIFPDLEIDNTTPPTTPRVCALLVTGFYQNENERTGFQATRSVMQAYLTRQPRGPRIPDAAVETLDNPTAAELEAKLMEFQGICDVLYFYYYGHGDASGLFLKSENNPARYTRLTYPMLAEDIYSVGAIDNTVVLDNCNSGAALPAFRSDPNYSRTNLTLLTGASADNLAYQAIRVNNTLLSFYTGGLAICANDPRADTDGVPGVTLKEAHTWLRRVNPRLLQFRNQMGGIDRFGIIEKQDPQLLENRVQPNDGQSAFFFEEAGVTVMVGSGGKQAGTSAIDAIRVEEVAPRGGIVPDDDDLIELSSRRHRTVEVLETGDPGFVIDIAFTMDAVLDSLTTTELPGLAFRTDDTGTWMPQVATVWDPADSTVTMTGVTTSGDWAFALTTGASSVSVEDAEEDAELPLTVALHGNYPNPFNPQTVIGYELPQAVRVRLAVYDLLGREVALLVDAPQAAGQYQAVFEASGLPSGVYVYQLTAGTTTHVQRMVLVR